MAEGLKGYVSTVRRAAYPDVKKFEEDRAAIEAAWPQYENDKELCRFPRFAFVRPTPDSEITSLRDAGDIAALLEDATQWKKAYLERLQYVMSRMNHHIHPRNPQTGERRPLSSCCKKGKPNVCKHGFPLDEEVTDRPLLVCECIADLKGLCKSGPRSLLGTILPERDLRLLCELIKEILMEESNI